MKMYQQGDVLLFTVDNIPAHSKKRKNNHLVEGEATGHFHAATGNGVSVLEAEEDVYLNAPNGCQVEHQEHKTIVLPAGAYKAERVQEYDHYTEEARKVRD